jgi:hypothetical protein
VKYNLFHKGEILKFYKTLIILFDYCTKLSALGKPDRNIPRDAELLAEYTLVNYEGNDEILKELKARFL